MSGTKLSVGINAYEANVAKRVGSNQYAYRLLVELEKMTRESPEIDWTIYLPESALFDLPKARSGFRYQICPPKKFWTQWRLPLEIVLHGRSHDVFVSLGHYGPRFSPVPTVVCVLDLAYLKFPQFFLPKDLYQLREWTKYSVQKASHVFTISEASREDIKTHYKRKHDDITIIYPGVDVSPVTNDQEVDSILQKYALVPLKYIISVGTIQPRKNMLTAIQAFETLCSDSQFGDEYKLVFVGTSGWMTEDFQTAIKNSPIAHRIVVTGFVEEMEKHVLIQAAGCSFLLGFYEGFGIPVVESLMHGVRPVVANTSSLPEVAGKYSILVDTYDVVSVMRGFQDALLKLPDSMERAQMREWAGQFSWVKSAQKLLEVLRERFGTKA